MKGYNPVIKEYPTTVEYEGDDKLVLKKSKGVLFGCEKARWMQSRDTEAYRFKPFYTIEIANYVMWHKKHKSIF